ncbi:MAG: protein translocase subunit SecD, partial [Pirellulales bacterium]|nr:protein translocase subunit SecD [Pirellulales bacterium]
VVAVVGWPPKLGIDLSGGVVLVYELADEDEEVDNQDKEKDDADAKQALSDEEKAARQKQQSSNVMERLIGAMEQRVNPGGARTIPIRRYGDRQIEVTIPMASTAEVRRVEKKISEAGTLEFRILANELDHSGVIELAKRTASRNVKDADGVLVARWVPVRSSEEEDFERLAADKVNSKIVVRPGHDETGEVMEALVVLDEWNVTGDYLSDCQTGYDNQTGSPCVLFNFNQEGAFYFSDLTGANMPEQVGEFSRKLGIILNDELFSAPGIQARIGASGQITGRFTPAEAKDLVDVLNAGSLPAKLKKQPISRLETGPTLGHDMIVRGGFAIGLSIVLVLVFMVWYYRFAGLVACGALLTNLVLILAIMILIKADFTLPGLAGLVLTVGMAVDANVLIFERIREELAKEAALRMAIRNGFGRALSAIVDANVTTLLTGFVLYIVGTPALRGFAIILILGVVLSMYTAIFCARIVFDVAEKRRWITQLNMVQVIGKTNVDFVGLRYAGAMFSGALIILGLMAVVFRGPNLLDIDFTGGVSAVVLFEDQQDIQDVRKALEDLPKEEELGDLTVTHASLLDEDTTGFRYVINTSRKATEEESEKLGKSSTDVVEGQLEKVFGSKLARNHLTYDIEKITIIEAEEPEAKEPKPAAPEVKKETPETKSAEPAAKKETSESKPAEPEAKKEATEGKPAEPKAGDQARVALPAAFWIATLDPTALLAGDADQAAEVKSVPVGPVLTAPAGQKGEAKDAPKKEAKDQKKKETPPKAAEPAPKETSPKEPAPKTPEPAPPVAEIQEAAPEMADLLVGGSQVDLNFSQGMDHDTLKEEIEKQLVKVDRMAPFELLSDEYRPGSTDAIQKWTLRIQLPVNELQELLLKPLAAKISERAYFPSSSSIGGTVAEHMQFTAIYALLGSLICIVIYIWIRFQRVMFGLAAVVALVHDVTITLGALAISAYLAPVLGFLMVEPFKISLAVLAAFLTIIGYSLNDTIVVFDRIREVKGKSPELNAEMINTSINQTLSRTLLTSLTTLLVVVILYIFGGAGIHAFAFTLMIGVLIGTYSSIFIASPILYWMSRPNGGGNGSNR